LKFLQASGRAAKSFYEPPPVLKKSGQRDPFQSPVDEADQTQQLVAGRVGSQTDLPVEPSGSARQPPQSPAGKEHPLDLLPLFWPTGLEFGVEVIAESFEGQHVLPGQQCSRRKSIAQPALRST